MNPTQYIDPIIYHQLSQRDNIESFISPNQLSAGMIFNHDVTKHTLSKDIVYFDASMVPCESIDQAMYIYHPTSIAPPTGFSHFGPDNRPSIAEWNIQAQNYAQTMSYTPNIPLVQEAPSPQQKEPKPKTTDAAPENNVMKVSPQAEKLVLEEKQNGFYVHSSKTLQHTQATNFLVFPTTITRYVKVDQGAYQRTIEFEILIYLHTEIRKQTITIPYVDVKDLLSTISKRFVEAIIYADGRGALISQFPQLIRQKLANIPQIVVYQSSGWQQLENNTLVYIHDGATPFNEYTQYECGFRFELPEFPLTPIQGLNNVWRLMQMANPKVNILVPILFAHLGCLWELFSLAGCPPHVLLFIQGISGSFKTAVASLLFNFSAQKENLIPASFRDTSSSLEVKMGLYKDRVLLVDDFCPAANSQSKKIQQQTLEQLVRFYGDGIGKSRTNPRLEEIYEKKPHGLCAITGEDVSGSYSSLLRCLFLEINKNCYDSTILSEFQEDPTQWTGHLYHFVMDCQHCSSSIIQFISQRFPEYRRRGEGCIKERRLIDTYSYLSITAELFIQYAMRLDSALTEDRAATLLAEMEHDIMTLCVRSEQQAVGSNPAKIFASILMDAIRLNTVRLGTVKEAEVAPSEFIGVVHQGFWYLWPQGAYKVILDRYRQEGGHFPLSQPALWQALAHADILIPAPQKSKGTERVEYGTRVSFLNRPRLLKISPEALQRLESE